MKLWLSTALFLCMLALTAGAQCGFDAMFQQQLRTDPAYAASVQQITRQIQALGADLKTGRRVITGRDTVYTIPLVVHVIHNGEPVGSPMNPSDAQLISWINYTDAAFNASWLAYPGPAAGGVRTGIHFVLAQTDRNCNPTSGIVRINGSAVPNYSANGIHYSGGTGTGKGADEMTIRNLSYWGQNNYINVWLVNKIDDDYSGFARYPGGIFLTADYGPVVLVSRAVNGDYTLAHELGHTLGLRHTFEGDNNGTACPPTTDCSNTGDFICDTEPDLRYPSCTATTNPCTGKPYGNVRKNFMNYTSCGADRFTAGQAAVMQMIVATKVLAAFSNSADSPIATPAMVKAACINSRASGFMASQAISGPTYVSFAGFTRASSYCRQEDSNVYVDNTCLYRGQVVAGKTYPLNLLGGNSIQYCKVFLDYNNDGAFQMPKEQILSLGYIGNQQQRMITENITIPTTGVVYNKPLRMRVIVESVEDTATSGTGPCVALLRGQAEDYAVTVLSSVGLNPEPASTAFSILPNPADAALTLRFDAPASGQLSLYNTAGAIIITTSLTATQEYAISTASLPAGLYHLTFRDAGGVVHQKLQITH